MTFNRDNLPEGGWNWYRKIATTLMQRIEGPFTVETREGVAHCEDGYLAVDSAGWPYPVAADEHERTYEVVK